MAETHRFSHRLEETPQILPSVQPQRTAPVEAIDQQEKPAGKRRRGRQKILIQRIHDDSDRLVTFSTRRVGIYKKGAEISTLCGVDVGILMFSPAGNPYAYGAPSIESIADRFLRGLNPEAQNDNVSRIEKEAQRRAHLGKLNNDFDLLTVYLQNLKEGDRLMQWKKQTFERDSWWDTPVEDLKADEMQRMVMAMEEIRKKSSERLGDLRAGASSSSAVVQLEDVPEGFGYDGDGGFGDFTEGGSSSAVVGVQSGVMQIGGNLGQGYLNDDGGSGGFGDSRVGGLTSEEIQGGDFHRDGNGGIGGYGGGVGMQMGGISENRYVVGVGGGFGDFTAGGSSMASVQQGGMQVGEYGGRGFGGGDVAGGGIAQWTPVGSAAASSTVEPGVGSMLVGENGINGHGGGVGSGFGDFTEGGSAVASIQQGGMQLGEYGGSGVGGGDVAGGEIAQWTPVGSAAASTAVQPGVGSMLVCGNGGGGYGGGITSGGGLSDGWKPVKSSLGGWKPVKSSLGGWKPVKSSLSSGWKPVNSSSIFKTIQGANPMQIASDGGCGVGGGDWVTLGSSSMQMSGNGLFGYKDGVGGSSAGGGNGGGIGDWRRVGSPTMQIGGIGGFGFNDNASGSFGSAGGGLAGGGAGGTSSPSSLQPNPMQMGRNGGLDHGGLGGGAGSVFGGDGSGFGDVSAGGSAALQPAQAQMGGASTGGSFYDGGGEFCTNNGFDDFFYDGGGKF